MTDYSEFVAPGRCGCCGRTTPIWSVAAIVDAMRAWAEANGRAPSSYAWRKAEVGHPSFDQVCEVFGTFDRARAAAGLRYQRTNGRGVWTRETVKAAFFRFVFLHGRLPRAREWATTNRSNDWPSTTTVRRLFGAWNAAVVAAGYEPSHPRKSRKGYAGVIGHARDNKEMVA
jgi:hypothetical protein